MSGPSGDFSERFEEVMARAYDLGEGPAKVALLEEAVRLADTLGEVLQGYEAREALIQAATFTGYPEKSMVAFSWCLAQCDRDPDQFEEMSLLWQYKWVLGVLPDFPQISRAQIAEASEDLARRLLRSGAGLRAVHKLRFSNAMALGDADTAREDHRRWEDSPRDWVSDCPACERDEEVAWLIYSGRDEDALTAAAPILSGRMRCAEIPHITLSRLLKPLLRLGRPAEAMPYHRKGYRLISSNREFLREVGRHLEFLVQTDNLARATKLFEKHLPWALESASPLRQFEFLLGARFLFERLGDTGKRSLKLRLPQDFPGHQPGGSYEVAALAAWLDQEVDRLAARFDTRNGNESFAYRIAESRQLREQITPCPLKPVGDPAADDSSAGA